MTNRKLQAKMSRKARAVLVLGVVAKLILNLPPPQIKAQNPQVVLDGVAIRLKNPPNPRKLKPKGVFFPVSAAVKPTANPASRLQKMPNLLQICPVRKGPSTIQPRVLPSTKSWIF
jgi:hypothetical protein